MLVVRLAGWRDAPARGSAGRDRVHDGAVAAELGRSGERALSCQDDRVARQRVVREGGMDPDIGAALAALFRLRLDADYGPGPLTAAQADSAIVDAERFVSAVERWLAQQPVT